VSTVVELAGVAVNDREVTHEQRMRLVVVDGKWRTPITLEDGDAYRLYAKPADLAVDDDTDGYRIGLEPDGTKDGEPVPTEPCLGGGGHLVALREGDLAFLHVHPDGEGVAFATYLQ